MTVSITISKKLLVIALATVLLLSAAAWALAQGNTPDYVYACVKNDQIQRFAVQAADCKKNETPIGVPTEAKILALEAQNAALQAQVEELGDLLQHFSRDGDDIFITGANLHVVNGTGTTDGTPNALGNVIIGYNESRAEYPDVWYPDPIFDDHTGSHMLVVGSANNYSRFGGIVAGFFNTTSGDYASVSGGERSTASGEYASVSGGSYNTANSGAASVSGGRGNTASDWSASVSGGYQNAAIGHRSWVGGGMGNRASGVTSSVSGGYDNEASGEQASVSGGTLNIASGVWSSVSGGYHNTATYDGASVSGGRFNEASGAWSSVSGGNLAMAIGRYSSVSGGRHNEASGDFASVLGGEDNRAIHTKSAIGGGQDHQTSYDYQFLPE